jgi:virulence factor Mce-like protein
MTRGRSTASIVASPVLVGSVTTLIVIVAVFLAYNANAGLPFVPTYDVRAEIPSGANLVEGNEVRVGGFRVGIVNKISARFIRVNGRLESVAIVDLKLDKVVEPLAKDTQVLVRPRSALGLKYIELTPGHSKDTFKAGSTIPLKNAGSPVEFDDLLNTFDQPTRQYEQDALTGYGDAFAGRGADLNRAIEAFAPFFDHLTPVMKNLNNPDTQLNQFFKQIGAVSAQVRPVSQLQADVFPLMADTFDAIANEPDALRQTIEKNPPTLDAGIQSLPVQRSFIAQLSILSDKLEPTARILPTALPTFNRALRVGTPVLRQTPALNRATGKTFDALDDLVKNPSVLLGLQQLNTTTTVTAPLLQYIAPYQTVCSYGNYFFGGLGGHISEGTTNGAAERVLLKSDSQNNQDNKWGDFPADRPADVPANIDPSNAYNGPVSDGTARQAAHTQPFAPAIDAQGNADCQIGNTGYIDGPLVKHGRYPPANDSPNFDATAAGGSHVVADADTPGLAGPTFLGVPRLSDVP